MPFTIFRDFVLPEKKFREPTDADARGLDRFTRRTLAKSAGCSAGDIQNVSMKSAAARPIPRSKEKSKDGKPGVSLDWFNLLYQVLLAGERPALRLVRCGITACRYRRHDDGALARSALKPLLACPDVRATHTTSDVGSVRSRCQRERFELNRLRGLGLSS